MKTIDLNKFKLRKLKNLRKVHRKRRAHPHHREAHIAVTSIIRRKQQEYFVAQAKVFDNRFHNLLKRISP